MKDSNPLGYGLSRDLFLHIELGLLHISVPFEMNNAVRCVLSMAAPACCQYGTPFELARVAVQMQRRGIRE